ncbi:MAG: hypothetical protein GY938_32025 [Ketobacter sp.]|nr:hypothetical protein [Ketobacter sp.]
MIDALTKEDHVLIDAFTMIAEGMSEFSRIARAYDKRMRQRAIKFNHGKPRKVSLKRPSPWLSRAELERIHDEEWGAV